MVEASTPAKVQELGRQVWHLPHVRMAVFDELSGKLRNGWEGYGEQGSLKRYMTLNRDTSLDIAFRLYYRIRLDAFPWDCPDEVSFDDGGLC